MVAEAKAGAPAGCERRHANSCASRGREHAQVVVTHDRTRCFRPSSRTSWSCSSSAVGSCIGEACIGRSLRCTDLGSATVSPASEVGASAQALSGERAGCAGHARAAGYLPAVRHGAGEAPPGVLRHDVLRPPAACPSSTFQFSKWLPCPAFFRYSDNSEKKGKGKEKEKEKRKNRARSARTARAQCAGAVGAIDNSQAER